MKPKEKQATRRDFLKKTSIAAAGAIVAPAILPSKVFGKTAPRNQINIGMVGTGRQAVLVNLNNGFLKQDNCRVVAVNLTDREIRFRLAIEMSRLAGCNWQLRDDINGATYLRDGDELLDPGLYVVLEPYGFHLFNIEESVGSE